MFWCGLFDRVCCFTCVLGVCCACDCFVGVCVCFRSLSFVLLCVSVFVFFFLFFFCSVSCLNLSPFPAPLVNYLPTSPLTSLKCVRVGACERCDALLLVPRAGVVCVIGSLSVPSGEFNYSC